MKKYNPDIVTKLESKKNKEEPPRLVIETPAHHISTSSPALSTNHTSNIASTSSSIQSNSFTYDENGIIPHDDIHKIKQICDEEINRYQKLYADLDKEYQAYKKKMSQDIQEKNECYLTELAQQKQQITKCQSEIAELRKNNLNQQEKCQTLEIENKSLSARLEQESELQISHQSDINALNELQITQKHDKNENIKSIKQNDIKHMESIITHQDAQIAVLMNTIETLQHHKPKKSQIVELTARLSTHEALQTQRKKELELIRSNWSKDQESKIIFEKQCFTLRAKLKSIKFELENSKKQNESIRNQFENYQRQIIEKENKIHELELCQSRLQSIRKQLESRANIMQNELDNLSSKHFQHLQTLSNEHQNQLKKLTKLYCNDNNNNRQNDKNENNVNNININHGLKSNISNDFHCTLKTLTHSLEKYLIHEQHKFDKEKKKLGLTSIEYVSLLNTFKKSKGCSVNINEKSRALETMTTLKDKHEFMKQLMNIVNDQYGNIISLQKQCQFYEWLSRHHYNKRKQSETNVLSIQCQLQVSKKHLKRVKNDIEHNHLIIQQQLETRKNLIKQQMNKSVHRYLILQTKCNKLRSELNATKKQCHQFETKYGAVLNKLNTKNIDLTEKEIELKQNISDALTLENNKRDKQLKEYLHENLKKIIHETVQKYEKNDLYENQIFELSNEILSIKYVQNELTSQLEKALFDNQKQKLENKKLSEIVRNSNILYDKLRKKQENMESGNDDDGKHNDDGKQTGNSTTSNSITQSPQKVMKTKDDICIIELEQDLCDKTLDNESLRNQINCLQKEIEELLESININKIKHENELKNMREQIAQEREVLIQNHNNEIANNHQQNQQKIQVPLYCTLIHAKKNI